MITPADREKYKYHTDESILGIKLIGGLTNKAITCAIQDMRVDTGKLSDVVEHIAALMDYGKAERSTNTSWICARILEEAQDRDMITDDEFDYLEKRI